ncbi:MAG: hypothetical protein WBE76_13715 [Terracidiphilus sp.]
MILILAVTPFSAAAEDVEGPAERDHLAALGLFVAATQQIGN